MTIELFTDTADILISIVSNSYYRMPREQIHINLPPEHPMSCNYLSCNPSIEGETWVSTDIEHFLKEEREREVGITEVSSCFYEKRKPVCSVKGFHVTDFSGGFL